MAYLVTVKETVGRYQSGIMPAEILAYPDIRMDHVRAGGTFMPRVRP
jgi:uncharacterized protein (DUF433 family)